MTEVGEIYPSTGTIKRRGRPALFIKGNVERFKDGQLVTYRITPDGMAFDIRSYKGPMDDEKVPQPPQRHPYPRYRRGFI